MTGHEEIDVGLLGAGPLVNSMIWKPKQDELKSFFKGHGPSDLSLRRSSSLLDKMFRRGSYNISGEDNFGFSLKKGSSVASSLNSSSSNSSSNSTSSSGSSRTSSRSTWYVQDTVYESQKCTKTELQQALSEEDIKNYFSFFNISNDGFITRRQLKCSMETLGLSLTDEELELMMETADEDGDGLVSFSDFKTFIASCSV